VEGRDPPTTFMPPPIWDADELLAEGALPEPLWLVPGLVPADNVTLIGGDGGLGKSTLVLQMAHCVRGGGFWLDRPCKEGSVVYVSAEENKRELHFRLDRMPTASSSRAGTPNSRSSWLVFRSRKTPTLLGLKMGA
jgi:hypothetical protein